VPVQFVRELYGVMIDRRASAAKVIAMTGFTPDALAFAKGKPIELVDSNTLLRSVRDVQTSPGVSLGREERDHLTPACPKCGATMVLGEARRGRNAGGKFWGARVFPVVAAHRRFIRSLRSFPTFLSGFLFRKPIKPTRRRGGVA
jgi:restriction system protein